MLSKEHLKKPLFLVTAIICLTPLVSSPLALTLGILFSLLIGNPYALQCKKITSKLLAISIIGLGAGMNLNSVYQVGINGLSYTVFGIIITILLGLLLSKILKTSKDVSLLISFGTAICGGSAIAATAPILRVKDQDISIALATVFTLNAIALLIFPLIGERLNLSQEQFGLWCALAIHDTSSVVGAALQYGDQAVDIATTVKLARAIWIIPICIVLGIYIRSINIKESSKKIKPKRPWFILGFIIMSAIITCFPNFQPVGNFIETLAKRLLIATLFVIGSGLTYQTLKQLGIKSLVYGVTLWFLVANISLILIFNFS